MATVNYTFIAHQYAHVDLPLCGLAFVPLTASAATTSASSPRPAADAVATASADDAASGGALILPRIEAGATLTKRTGTCARSPEYQHKRNMQATFSQPHVRHEGDCE